MGIKSPRKIFMVNRKITGRKNKFLSEKERDESKWGNLVKARLIK